MTRSHLPPVLRRWRVAALVVGVCALAGGGVLLAAPSDPATALAFHTVPTTRVLDTRPATQVGTRSTPLGLGETLDLVIPGLPDDATGVNINVTAVDGTEGSFLTIYPTGDARPTASTVNWDAAGAVANTATVVVHPAHSVTIYNLKGTVDVVIDLLGFYAPTPVGGSPGPTGPQGIQGIAGPAGPIGPAVYLYANNTSNQGLALDELVSFDSVGATLGGITVDMAKSGFTVPTDGVYKVSFGLVGDEENQFAIVVNNVDSLLDGALVFGGLGAGIPTEGTAVLRLAAGQKVALMNRASTGDYSGNVVLSDEPFGGSEPELNAWIVIEQLNG